MLPVLPDSSWLGSSSDVEVGVGDGGVEGEGGTHIWIVLFTNTQEDEQKNPERHFSLSLTPSRKNTAGFPSLLSV